MNLPQNIFVVGPQSTGKTTLVNALDHHFQQNPPAAGQPLIIREVARDVLQEHGLGRANILSSPSAALEIQKLILVAQSAAETVAIADSPRWFMSDRSGIDPIAYAQIHVGYAEARAMFDMAIWQDLETTMKKSLVCLCEAGGPYLVDDGVRVMPRDMGEWKRIETVFRVLLEERGIAYVLIPSYMTSISERLDLVLLAHGSK